MCLQAVTDFRVSVNALTHACFKLLYINVQRGVSKPQVDITFLLIKCYNGYEKVLLFVKFLERSIELCQQANETPTSLDDGYKNKKPKYDGN